MTPRVNRDIGQCNASSSGVEKVQSVPIPNGEGMQNVIIQSSVPSLAHQNGLSEMPNANQEIGQLTALGSSVQTVNDVSNPNGDGIQNIKSQFSVLVHKPLNGLSENQQASGSSMLNPSSTNAAAVSAYPTGITNESVDILQITSYYDATDIPGSKQDTELPNPTAIPTNNLTNVSDSNRVSFVQVGNTI